MSVRDRRDIIIWNEYIMAVVTTFNIDDLDLEVKLFQF